MSTALILALAMILDAAMGEPRWLWSRIPHPAVLMGRAVGFLDLHFNHPGNTRAKGVLTMVILAIGAIGLGYILQAFGASIVLLCVAILLAQRSLCDHVKAVANALRLSLAEGRTAVAQIVGRGYQRNGRPCCVPWCYRICG